MTAALVVWTLTMAVAAWLDDGFRWVGAGLAVLGVLALFGF